MSKKVMVFAFVFLMSLVAVVPALAAGADGRHISNGTVYVTSQDLYYDTFVSAQELPQEGPFQRIYDGETEFGPGDQGYVGGRWWVDKNNNFEMDEGDVFLLCPLLGPGRAEP